MFQPRSGRLAAVKRTWCVAVAACAVWLASSVDAGAGVIVATDLQSVGGMSAPPTPAAPQPVSPLVGDHEQESLHLGTTNNTQGAGSQAPTNGPGTGLVAVVSQRPATAQNTLISRLALFSRISLPSPLEDRFFRPPRV